MSDDLTTPGAVRRAWIEAMDGTSPAAKTAPAPAAAPSLAERVAGLESALGIVSEALAMHHAMLGDLFDAEHFPLTLAAELLEDLRGYEDHTPPEWIRERAMLAKRLARLEAVVEDAERDRDRLRSVIDQLAADAATARADRGLRDAEICDALRLTVTALSAATMLALDQRLTPELLAGLRAAIDSTLDRLDPPELRAECPGCGATDDADDVCVCDCAVLIEEDSP